ncbi:MAG: serine protease [Clostridia bacterium]|nr:serine protease [Clostridia bacterium]
MKFRTARQLVLTAVALLAAAVLPGCQTPCEHSYSEWETLTASTCLQMGEATRTCQLCGEQDTSVLQYAACQPVLDEGKAPTCTEDGMTEGSHCAVCGKAVVAQTVLPATGHTPVIDAGREPTCKKPGETEGSHCAVCEEVLVAQSTIPITDVHVPEIDAAVKPTCSFPGKTEGSHCAVCRKVLVAQEDVPRVEHTYANPTVMLQATCKESGGMRYTCSVCSHQRTFEYVLEKQSAAAIHQAASAYVGEIVTYGPAGEPVALGSCFVYESNGKILTNYHVIEGAYSAKITLGGKSYDVLQVLGYNKDTDLAMLKIEASGLPTALVCTEKVAVGDVVYAVGSSQGLSGTFSQGIITYAARELEGVTYVQHDAAISSGNSGGPLINEYGEVIGINTMTRKDSQNLNFAVFTGELSSLTELKDMTLAQLYAAGKKSSHSRLAVWVQKNGQDIEGTKVVYYYQPGVIMMLIYEPTQNALVLSVQETGGSTQALTALHLPSDGSATWEYMTMVKSASSSMSLIELYGQIDVSVYQADSTLTYSEHVGATANIQNGLAVTQELLNLGLDWLAWMMETYGVGLTLSDLGFSAYEG